MASPRTHQRIDPTLSGHPLDLAHGRSVVELITT